MSEMVAAVRFRAGIGGEPVVAGSRDSEWCSFEPARWGAELVSPPSLESQSSSVNVEVGVGCCADVRSHPDGGTPPPVTFNVHVQSDAMLTWRLHPAVAVSGTDRETEASVRLAGSARLLWGEEMAVGRAGEPGTWRSRLRVARDGWPVVCRDLAIGPGWPLWRSPVVLGGASSLCTAVIVDPARSSSYWKPNRMVNDTAAGVALPLIGPGLQLIAWGEDLESCRDIMGEMLDGGRVPGWAAARWDTPGRLAAAFEPLIAL